jgi:hypothetical protein
MDKTFHGLQDTNDRYLGNIQRDGTYSIIPRVSGGEITPDKLIVIGNVAEKYNLYTKITGGQRIDMFGAKKHDLIAIWIELIAGGLESGHDYEKSLQELRGIHLVQVRHGRYPGHGCTTRRALREHPSLRSKVVSVDACGSALRPKIRSK